MRLALVVGIAALSGCNQAPARPDNVQHGPEAVLVVHWREGGNDYTREFATIEGCESARTHILNDSAARTRTTAEVSSQMRVRMQPDMVPVVWCLLT